MAKCPLEHIPKRLHQDNRPLDNHFEVGERVYHRCTKKTIENPFLTISIADVSVNRQGRSESILSEKEDVLWDIRDDGEKKYDLEICEMLVVDLDSQNKYDKTFTQEKNNQTYTARLVLSHQPVKCMYPHCEFKVYLNGTLVTKDDYKDKIRTKLRFIHKELKKALGEMILREEISQSA